MITFTLMILNALGQDITPKRLMAVICIDVLILAVFAIALF